MSQASGILSYRIKRIEDVEPMARMLAEYFPRPFHVVTGIYELLINGLEHGNLEIGFASKAQLIRDGKWREEILKRQNMPEYSDRRVLIELEQKEDSCAVHIRDQGKGFNWKYYLNNEMPDHLPHGRGLHIVRATGFDKVEFNKCGNEVSCVVKK